MNIAKMLKKERMGLLKGLTKEAVLSELVDCAIETGCPCQREELAQEILHREELMSTGIGLGIGLPHVRLDAVSELMFAIGVQPKGIENYESLDNQPVKIVVMIIAGKEQHKQYLTLLASVVKILKRPQVIDSLLSAKNVEELYDVWQKEAANV